MKKIFLFILLILAVACEKEEPINAELGKPKRNYDVNSSDPILKYVSQFYYEYGREFIVDPDSSDWLYNFQIKNKIKIIAPEKNSVHIQYGIDLMKELFLNNYDNKFISGYFPNNLILASEIRLPEVWGSGYTVIDVFTATNYIALNIGGTDRVFTEEEKMNISGQLHYNLIAKFIIAFNRHQMDLQKFYAPCASIFGTTADSPLPQEEIYKLGFIRGVQDYSHQNTKFPLALIHVQQWVEFILTHDAAEIETIINTYPAMKINYDLLIGMVKEGLGLDLTKLTYKPKN